MKNLRSIDPELFLNDNSVIRFNTSQRPALRKFKDGKEKKVDKNFNQPRWAKK